MNLLTIVYFFWQILLIILGMFIGRLLTKRTPAHESPVELHGSQLLVDNRNAQGNTISRIPHVAIQNVGKELVYLDSYTANGKEYRIDSQILPSTYSHVIDNFYRIELPTSTESYVSMEVQYHDVHAHRWCTKIIAEKNGPFGWDIKTLPKTKSTL